MVGGQPVRNRDANRMVSTLQPSATASPYIRRPVAHRPATYAAFTTPVAAIRLTMNALSSAGGKVTATILQAGIG